MIEFFVYLVLFFVFCIGTVIGSFLNVVILRAFSKESIILPPSKCPKCGNKLKWWHNIPILSYIMLRGKCYFCHEKISIQYPVIELITGLVFVAVFMRFGIQVDTFFAFAVAGLLIVIAATDIKEKVVFDMHTYSLVGVGLVYNLYAAAADVYDKINTISGFQVTTEWCLNNPLTISVLGLIVGVVVMEIAARIGYVIAGERAFGEGDTYIAAGLGAVFGWKNVILILIMAVILQILFTLPLFIRKLAINKNWMTLFSISGFFVYALLFYFVDRYTKLFDNPGILYTGILLMLLSGVFACINVIKGLKNKDNLTYLPFGPALAFSGLILLCTNANILLGVGG